MKKKISISVEMETASKLLETLAKKRKEFPSKSGYIEHAVNEAFSDNAFHSRGAGKK